MGILGLKIHLETKLREELSHGSKAQTSFLPSSPLVAVWGGCLLCQGTFPKVITGRKRTHRSQEVKSV